jgi:uncharacterized protein DUF4838/glycosyl hydrolase family 67
MKRSLLGFFAFFSLFSLLIHAEIPLTKDKKALAEIVVDAKADKVIKYAASELQHWVEEISGAKLAIVNKPDKMKYKIILQVNPAAFEVDLKKMQDNDGYALREKGNKLYLIASKSKGILNGVFKLLFKNTDIIWARPNVEFGTLFSKNPNLTLTKTDYIDIPVYVLRGWQMIGSGYDIPSEIWQVRNGSNWSAATLKYNSKFTKFGNVLEHGGGHNLVKSYITGKKYFKDHPDFFPLINGKRVRPTSKRKVQLCFMNPEMTKAFIREVDKKIKKYPNYDTYRIMIEDNYNLCNCSKCVKPIKLANGKTIDKKDRAFRSTQFFLFLNQIARHMQKNYPGKKILTFGYFFTQISPHCKVEPNISISFCPIFKNSRATIQAPCNTKTKNKFAGWMKYTKNLTWREYFGLTGSYPRPIDAIAIADWQYVNKFGINKTYSEMYSDAIGRRANGIKTWNTNSMYFWTLANASWNPYQDVKILRKEFLKRVYGKAANDVEEFYSILEKSWYQINGISRWNDKSSFVWRRSVEEQNLGEKCRKLLESAATKVSNAKSKKMLAALSKTFDEEMNLINDTRVYAVKVQKKPVFDPDFKSAEWQKAIPTDRFYMQGKAHKDRTVLRILYDNKNLYFGIKCYYKDVKNMHYAAPNPGKKQFPNGEGFELFLSKAGATKKSYSQVVVDPINNRYWGGRYAGKWKSQAKITADGWSAMVTFSLARLGLKSAASGKFCGAFVRQFMHKSAKKGAAPDIWASLLGSKRHKQKTFIEVTLKK